MQCNSEAFVHWEEEEEKKNSPGENSGLLPPILRRAGQEMRHVRDGTTKARTIFARGVPCSILGLSVPLVTERRTAQS